MNDLKKLTARKSLYVLGLNSGTSADGIDLALIKFTADGKTPAIEFMAGDTITYRPDIRREIEYYINRTDISPQELARFDISYGHLLGETASRYLKGLKQRVDLIASHGQTIGHYPAIKRLAGVRSSASLQVGDGNAIAAQSGIPVVYDFRRSDIALSGEGAPLTPFVNHLLFADSKKSRIIVNIGGISNYTYLPAGKGRDKAKGGDCGPGNVLLDLAARLLFHQPFDRDGSLAAQGKVVTEIVAALKKRSRMKTVSTGREQFDETMLARAVHLAKGKRYGFHDILASLSELTARTIAAGIREYLSDKRLEGIYLAGGGRRNIDLVNRLIGKVKPNPVWPIEALGFDGDYLEAVSFAVLGGCFINGIRSGMPQITGAKTAGFAGKLALPPGR